VRSGAFSDPRWDGSSVLKSQVHKVRFPDTIIESKRAYHSISDTSDNTRHDELPKAPVRTKRSDTDDCSDDHNDTANEHHLLSSKGFSHKEGNQSSEESTAVELTSSVSGRTKALRRATYTSYTAVTVP
jgi:hypothetical protein